MAARTIEDEQLAFDKALPSLLEAHTGEYVLFHDGRAVAFCPTRGEAYQQGLETFGLEETFLVSEVKPKRSETASLSWELGVMFGQ